jgi:hypothetical protein
VLVGVENAGDGDPLGSVAIGAGWHADEQLRVGADEGASRWDRAPAGWPGACHEVLATDEKKPGAMDVLDP